MPTPGPSRPGWIHLAATLKAGSRVSTPGSGRARGVGVDSKQAVALGLPTANLDAAQRDHILARTETEIVRDVDGGDDEAELRGEMTAEGAHAVEHLAALFLVDHGG